MRVDCDKEARLDRADNDDHLPYEEAEEREESDKKSNVTINMHYWLHASFAAYISAGR